MWRDPYLEIHQIIISRPRKDDDSIDAISTEERSVYSSPPHEAAGNKEVLRETIENDAVEEMKSETENTTENDGEENILVF